MSDKKTFIGIALDRSGSMATIRKQIIDGFNEQLDELQRNADKGGETTITFVTFGGHYAGGDRKPIETVMENAKPDHIQELSNTNYVPGGLTPMYDGIMSVVETLERLDDSGDDTAMLLLVFSDGLENHSQEYTSEQVVDKFDKLEESDRWTIVYIGANQNLAEIEKHLGIGADNSVVLPDADPDTVSATTSSMSSSTEAYMSARSAGQTKTAYASSVRDDLDEDEKAQNTS